MLLLVMILNCIPSPLFHVTHPLSSLSLSLSSMYQWLGSLQIHEFNQTAMRLKEQQKQKQSTSPSTAVTMNDTQPKDEIATSSSTVASMMTDSEQPLSLTGHQQTVVARDGEQAKETQPKDEISTSIAASTITAASEQPISLVSDVSHQQIGVAVAGEQPSLGSAEVNAAAALSKADAGSGHEQNAEVQSSESSLGESKISDTIIDTIEHSNETDKTDTDMTNKDCL